MGRTGQAQDDDGSFRLISTEVRAAFREIHTGGPLDFLGVRPNKSQMLVVMGGYTKLSKTMRLTLALDWTPNTNHTGFFVALAKGYYAQVGLDVQISHPGQDNYETTPARQLVAGVVDLALSPTESIISLHHKPQPVAVRAVAAILQQDTSAIVTLADSAITRPAALDGRVYASYRARYEDEIVRQLIIRDGGKGDIRISYPQRLGIWDTLLAGKADATWIFEAWEGVEAARHGVALRYFRLRDVGIPYGYSPVLSALDSTLAEKPQAVRAFLQATSRGFVEAVEYPAESVEYLRPHISARDAARIDLLDSQLAINPFYLRDGRWGQMQADTWQTFLDWLHSYGFIPEMAAQTLYTNSFLAEV